MQGFVDLKNRIGVSFVLIVLVGILISVANYPISQIITMLLVGGLAMVAVWEYLQLLKIKNIEQPFWLLSSLTVFFVFVNYLSVININLSVVLYMFVAAFFFTIFFYNFSKVDGAIVKIATCIFGAIYIALPLGLMIKILYPATISTFLSDGRIWLAYLITVTKATDVGGYFLGKLWGKGRLAPTLSPGKTISGAAAGFILAILVSLIFFAISTLTHSNIFRINFLQAIILGGLIGIFGQLGDLAESLLKRDANVKDSNTIPGIGGVLDLLDSLLFSTPIVYIFLRTLQ